MTTRPTCPSPETSSTIWD